MRNFNQTVFSAQPIASVTSAALNARQWYAASFIARFTVTDAAGTMKIQASNAVCEDGTLPSSFVPPTASWVDVPLATATIAAGVAAIIPMPLNICYTYLRVVWTRSGGTGAFTVEMNIQGF